MMYSGKLEFSAIDLSVIEDVLSSEINKIKNIIETDNNEYMKNKDYYNNRTEILKHALKEFDDKLEIK